MIGVILGNKSILLIGSQSVSVQWWMKEKLVHVFGPFRYFKIEAMDKKLTWDQISGNIFLLHCLKKKSILWCN